jgi:hypothetical protein
MSPINEKRIEQIDRTYWKDHQVDGIAFTRWMHSDGYYGFGTDADNAIFTGFYLAAAAFHYGMTKNGEDLKKIEDTLDGIHLLTHISGTPGVLARLAFPLEDAFQRIGYSPESQQPKPAGWGPGNTWTDRKVEGSMYESDTHFYYCRTTRDQLTGIVYGLSVAWNILGKNRNIRVMDKIKTITKNLVDRLEDTNWSMKDHTGLVGDTGSAHRPRYQLKYALLHLNYIANGGKKPSSFRIRMLYKFMWFHTFYYRFTQQMFAWNLRSATAFSLWINETDVEQRLGAIKWMKRISSFTKDEDNAFFVFTESAMTNVLPDRIKRAYERLEDLAAVGHNKFFAWQKSKGEADVAGTGGVTGPGIDVLLPYWAYTYQCEGNVPWDREAIV